VVPMDADEFRPAWQALRPDTRAKSGDNVRAALTPPVSETGSPVLMRKELDYREETLVDPLHRRSAPGIDGHRGCGTRAVRRTDGGVRASGDPAEVCAEPPDRPPAHAPGVVV